MLLFCTDSGVASSLDPQASVPAFNWVSSPAQQSGVAATLGGLICKADQQIAASTLSLIQDKMSTWPLSKELDLTAYDSSVSLC